MSQGQGLQDAEVVTLHVGNLPFAATPEQLRELFAAHTAVVSIDIPNDPQTGQSRGFAFVEFNTPDEANNAVEMLQGKELGGWALTVNIARPREDRPPGGGGGFRGDRGPGGEGGGGGGWRGDRGGGDRGGSSGGGGWRGDRGGGDRY